MADQPEQTLRLRVYIIASLSVAGALALLVWALTLPTDSFWRGMLSNVGQTILVGGVLSLAYEYFLRDDMLKMQSESEGRIVEKYESISEKFDLAEGAYTLGLRRIHQKERLVDYGPILVGAKSIVLMFNDGRTWFSTHQADLAERLAKPNLETVVLLVHPNSKFLDALADKVSVSREQLVSKIEESIRMLKAMVKNGHKLEIYGHFMPASYSLCLSEDRAIFVPYPISRKEDRIPAFEFAADGDGSYYFMLKRDVDTTLAECSAELFPTRASSKPIRIQETEALPKG